MKKMVRFLPNIILGLYLIIYIPVLKYLFSLTGKFDEEGRLFMPYEANENMRTISLFVVIFALILKIVLKKTKYNLEGKSKLISWVLFIIEVVLIFFMGMLTAVA